jgi:hypothetical protein
MKFAIENCLICGSAVASELPSLLLRPIGDLLAVVYLPFLIIYFLPPFFFPRSNRVLSLKLSYP